MLRVAKVKHLSSSSPSSSIESLAHQFLQRCSVSGTAKGKGKAAVPLKRSKITTKKGGGGGDPGAKRGPNEAEAMVDRCLNAPTPLRHLKPKQQAREDERKKLGLKSKVHEIEAAMLKKGKEKLGVPEKPDVIGTPGLDLITLGLVDAEKIPKYELTVEDGRRLAKEYSRVLMRKHRGRQAAETTVLRLKKEATEALPEHLKVAAMVPDLSPFPANRFMATLTPPIEGYLEKVMEAAAKKSASKERQLR